MAGKPEYKGKKDGAVKHEGHGNGYGKKRPAPAGAGANGDKKSFMDQKVAKKQRKMQRPHYETVSRAKEIWNVIRERDVEKNKRTKLVQELFELVQGKVYEIAAKHDASRVIQSLLKFGKPEHRTQTITELKDHIVELAKTQYGCFLVQKMIKYGGKQDRALIVKQLTGHVITIGTHNIAANVLEYAQEHLQPSQLSGLKLEFYGKEFAYFKSESKKNLTDLLAAYPEKRAEILKNLGATLNRMADKQLLGLAFVQSLLWDYFSNADHEDVMQMILNVRDASLALLATRNGARVVTKCISYGNPKDRKRIIKCLKDKVLEACNHPSGYLVILRILDVVDDTVTVQKSVLAELKDSLFDVAVHPTGRKVLLQMLSPLNKKYLSADDIELLAPPKMPSPEDPSLQIINYKKEPSARRDELLKGMLPKLETMCIENAHALMRSKEGRDVLVEVIKASSSSPDVWVEPIVAAINAEPESEEQEPVVTDANAHFALRRIIKETHVAEPLLEAVQDNMAEWTKVNRSAFVVLAFLEAEHGSKNAKTVVKKALKADMSDLKKLTETQAGTKLVLDKLN
ncbi:TPA: hypothetical protein N0F65_001801 [Lagenidium giganteum]|uniref:PUM-HD domain-containing protein n=1 Tax=Lagenidium giganteum TaxID=4803 RepID=A0AAV2Z4H3_9STRA|nr:TPA: hypothetical protein N0F65_001801 [Lagenidium giganteum]